MKKLSQILFVLITFLAACVTNLPKVPESPIPFITQVNRGIALLTPTNSPTFTPMLFPSLTPFPTIFPTSTPSPTPFPLKLTKDNIKSVQMLNSIGSNTSIHSISISPDGRWIALSGGLLKIMNLETREIIETDISPDQSLYSPDGKYLAVINRDMQIDLLDTQDFKPIRKLGNPDEYYDLIAWSPDNTRLASFGVNLEVWDIASGEQVHEYEIPFEEVWVDDLCLKWSPDGQNLALAGLDDKIRIYNSEGVTELEGHSEVVTRLDWSPDGAYLASSSSYEPIVIIWRASNWNRIASITNHQFWVLNVEWSSDGKYIATADASGTLFIRNPKNGSIIKQFSYFYSPQWFNWSPSGTMIAIVRDSLKIYDIENKKEIPLPEEILTAPSDVRWLPKSDRLLISNADNRVQLVEIATGNIDTIINPEIGHISSMAFSPDAKFLAIGEMGGDVLIYDLTAKTKDNVLRGFRTGIIDLAWSPDSSALSGSAYEDNRAIIWDVRSKEPINTISAGKYEAHSDWSPVGSQIVTGNLDGEIFLWDSTSGKLLSRIGVMQDSVAGVEFSPDGTQVASFSQWNGKVIIWDINHKIKPQTIPVQVINGNSLDEWYLRWIEWSPDGTKLAVSYDTLGADEFSSNDYCQINDLTSSKPIFTFEEYCSRHDAWSPDGTMIALTNGEIRDVQTGDLLVSNKEVGYEFWDRGGFSWSPDGFSIISRSNGLGEWGVQSTNSP